MYTYITHSHKNGPIDVSTVFQSGLQNYKNAENTVSPIIVCFM